MTPTAQRTPRNAVTLVSVAAGIMAACWFSVSHVAWRQAPDLSHGWIVPLLAAYLLWERWPERPNVRPLRRVPATFWLVIPLLGSLALIVRLLLTPYPLWPSALLCFLALASTASVLGAALLAGKPGVRWVGGPLLLFVCSVPLPSSVEFSVILPLREAIARLVADSCNALGHPAIASGTSVHLGGGWVGIEEACGGIRSLQACILFAVFFGEWFRFGAARRLILLGLALGAAIGGNFGRVLFLALHAVSAGELTPGLHDAAGWVAMLASLLLTGAVAAAWNRWRLPVAAPAIARTDAATAAPRWMVAMALVFAANEIATRAWFAFGKQTDKSVPRWTAALPVALRSFSAEPLSSTEATILRPDRYVAGHWMGADQLPIDAYFIEWTHGQVARSVPFQHNPSICLPYAGCQLTATLPPIEVRWRGGMIPFATYQFRRTGESLLVAFTIWDPARGQTLQQANGNRSWWRWFLPHWRDVTSAREDQPAQLLAVSIAGGAEKRAELATLLQTLVVPSP